MCQLHQSLPIKTFHLTLTHVIWWRVLFKVSYMRQSIFNIAGLRGNWIFNMAVLPHVEPSGSTLFRWHRDGINWEKCVVVTAVNEKQNIRVIIPHLIMLLYGHIEFRNICTLAHLLCPVELTTCSLPTAAGFKATFLGNTPCGVYKYKLPKAVRTDSLVGTKVFFFKAILSDRGPPAATSAPFVWVKKGELERYLKPAYMRKVERFILGLWPLRTGTLAYRMTFTRLRQLPLSLFCRLVI